MKNIFFIFIITVFTSNIFASPVSQEYAEKIATCFYKHYAPDKTDFTVSDVVIKQKEGVNTLYIFLFKSGGFVLVSADDAAIPVPGFSGDSPFDKENYPENVRYWYESYSEQIKYIIDEGLDNSETLSEWNNIINDKWTSSKGEKGMLCSTEWDQGCYYNEQCPADGTAINSCGHTYTGCVATAMAQIMKYWNYPATGTGSHSYTHPTYGTLTANFGTTTYNWGNMPNSVTSSNSSVAKLLFHCGVAVDMNYGVNGSGTYSSLVPDALINYFGYKNIAEVKFMADFSSANWINLLKAEIDASHPVYYSGVSGNYGHAFVCDGYNTSDQFHFNWGWSGYYNGYYTIGSLNPYGYSFNQNNMAVVRITPPSNAPVANFGVSTNTPAVGGSVNFSDYSTNNPASWSWSFSGAVPAVSTAKNPANITYPAAGYYQVSLTVSNADGTDTKVRTHYINVGGVPSKWIKQNSGFATASRGIDQISIVNPYIAWAKAYDGTAPTSYIREFTRTINGGITWTPGTITFVGSASYGVSNIFAVNDTVCYACMFPLTGTGGCIVKTTDGGVTWAKQTSASFTGSWANFVHFFNTTDGVAMGDPAASGGDFVIYTTSNSGINWTQVSGVNIPNANGAEAGISNQFDAVGNTIWFGTTAGRVLKSTDKGLNWTVSYTGLGTSTYVTPVFKDANTGVAIIISGTSGAYTGLRKTTNGGTSWTTVTPTGYYLKYPNLDYIPGTSAMWVDVSSGPGTGSSYSLNDCASFLDIDTSSTIQYTCVKFLDINTGWAGSFNVSATDGGIYKWDPSTITAADDISKEQPGSITVYPNPADGLVNVRFDGITEDRAVINVYNLIGGCIISHEVFLLFNDVIQLDFSGNNAGIYFVTVNTGSKVITKKVSVIR